MFIDSYGVCILCGNRVDLFKCVLDFCDMKFKFSFQTFHHGEVTPSLINAYMCAQDLFIGGLFTLQRRL